MTLLSHLGLAVATFTVTNIDDLLILTMYFASHRYKTLYVVSGQYLGIATLVAVSLTGVLLDHILAPQWISLLGILPLGLGIRGLLSKDDDTDAGSTSASNATRFQFFSVAAVTIANGGDNLGVYIPLFAAIRENYLPLYLITFAMLTGIWCALGFWFVSHPRIKELGTRYASRMLPFFLLALGVWILGDFMKWMW